MTSRRLLVTDQYSKIRFLIDTGSDLCCFPKKLVQRKVKECNYQLSAANNSCIKTYGTLPLKLNLKLRREFTWDFVIADVSMPIIGADFLAHYNLLPDCAHNRLVDGLTHLFSGGTAAIVDQPSIKSLTSSSRFARILAEFPLITKPPGIQRDIKHTTVHYINTTPGPPISCRPRRLASLKLQAAKSEFEAMLQNGTVRPSKSPWASPLHMVLKTDSSWRPCGDYRQLMHGRSLTVIRSAT